jgi:hypothetical protein
MFSSPPLAPLMTRCRTNPTQRLSGSDQYDRQDQGRDWSGRH